MGNKAKIGLVSFLALFLCQCSKEGMSKDVEIIPLSKSPLLRVTPRQVGTGEIQPNWFDANFIITNNSQYSMRLEEVLFYVTVDAIEQSPKFFDLGLLTIVNSDGISFDYTSYCIYPVGYSDRVKTCRSDAVDVTNPDDDIDDNDIPEWRNLTFYIGELPNSSTGSKVYRVQAEFHGVFIDSAGFDIERLEKRVYFTTR